MLPLSETRCLGYLLAPALGGEGFRAFWNIWFVPVIYPGQTTNDTLLCFLDVFAVR
jgi:hypothetical protein